MYWFLVLLSFYGQLYFHGYGTDNLRKFTFFCSAVIMFHLQGSVFKTLPTLPKLKCYLIWCNNQVVAHGSITIQWVNNPQWINQKKLDFCGLLHKIIIRTLSPYYSRGDSVNQGVTKLSISFVWQACHFIVPKIKYFSSFYPSDHNLY